MKCCNTNGTLSLSRGIFRMQYNIFDEVLYKIVNNVQPSSFILDVRLGSEYASAFNKTTDIFYCWLTEGIYHNGYLTIEKSNRNTRLSCKIR